MKHGFSLVELSIVLVILGLLTGGILAGQSLIRAAELRSVSASMQSYTASIHSFRDKYFALPGDITNAKSFWTSCTDHTNNTCNGNGNGQWDNNGCTGAYSSENNRAWQHMALAGLIEGDYSTGLNANCPTTSSTAPYNGIPGTTVPRLRLSNGGAMLYNMAGAAGWPTGYVGVLTAGGYGGNALEASLFLPEEAWNIDTKMDDGRAQQGNLRSVAGASSTCVTSGEYALTNTALGCRIAQRFN